MTAASDGAREEGAKKGREREECLQPAHRDIDKRRNQLTTTDKPKHALNKHKDHARFYKKRVLPVDVTVPTVLNGLVTAVRAVALMEVDG